MCAWMMSAYTVDDFLSDLVFAVCSCACSTPSDDRTADENVSMAAQPGQQGGRGGELGVDDDCRERCLLAYGEGNGEGKDWMRLVSLASGATALLMYAKHVEIPGVTGSTELSVGIGNNLVDSACPSTGLRALCPR